MKQVHTQTETSRRERFAYRDDRHYVRVEAPNGNWDGPQLDQLLDTIDPETGEFAYREEANGTNVEGRRVTQDRRLVLLSCSADYAKRQEQHHVNLSQRMIKEQFNLGPARLGGGVESDGIIRVADKGVTLADAFAQDARVREAPGL